MKIPFTLSGNLLRGIFGFMLLASLTILAAIIGLGNVNKDSSYGLEIVLGSLTTLTGAFAGWAFGGRAEPEKPEPKAGDATKE